MQARSSGKRPRIRLSQVRVAHPHALAIHARIEPLSLGEQLSADDAPIAIIPIDVKIVPGRAATVDPFLLGRTAPLQLSSGIDRPMRSVMAGGMTWGQPDTHIRMGCGLALSIFDLKVSIGWTYLLV